MRARTPPCLPHGAKKGAEGGGESSGAQAGAGLKRHQPDHEALLEDVRAKRVRQETLADKLRLHVEQADTTAALETVTAVGMLRPRQELFLSPFDESAPRVAELHHPHFVLRLQERCVFP